MTTREPCGFIYWRYYRKDGLWEQSATRQFSYVTWQLPNH